MQPIQWSQEFDREPIFVINLFTDREMRQITSSSFYKVKNVYPIVFVLFCFPVTPINQFLIILGRCTLYTPVCLQDEPTCMRIEPV